MSLSERWALNSVEWTVLGECNVIPSFVKKRNREYLTVNDGLWAVSVKQLAAMGSRRSGAANSAPK